jgi:hypothetical protein
MTLGRVTLGEERMRLPEPAPGSARELVRAFTKELRTHMAYPLYFLQQAAAALDGGSTIGTSILCRAALEAAYCQFLQYAVPLADGSGYDMTRQAGPLPGQRKPGDRVDFGGVVQAIEASNLLDVEQLLASKRIRHNGNWVAHIVQVTEKEGLLSLDPLHWTPWIDETRARADLEDALDIVRTIESAFPSIYK